jgi:hypothetical protein
MVQGSWFLYVVAGIGAILLILGLSAARRTHTLRRTGGKAQALVVDIDRRQGSQGRTSYRPVVRWVTPEGYEVRAVPAAGRPMVDTPFLPGNTVLVHYERTRPERILIEGYNKGAERTVSVIGALALVISIVLLVLD